MILENKDKDLINRDNEKKRNHYMGEYSTLGIKKLKSTNIIFSDPKVILINKGN